MEIGGFCKNLNESPVHLDQSNLVDNNQGCVYIQSVPMNTGICVLRHERTSNKIS